LVERVGFKIPLPSQVLHSQCPVCMLIYHGALPVAVCPINQSVRLYFCYRPIRLGK
jgi:hypothetical protein